MTQTGWGYDSHRFVKGRKLVLGGVGIPFKMGLKGHSDADAALHALIDALLGAAALGDIGTLFPDSDPRFKGADSLRLLADTARRIAPRFRIVHVDVTVLAEVPKLGPYKNRMRAKIGHALNVPIENVSVKAKTNEGMGFVGKKEGIAAVAVATLEKKLRRAR
ncbi:MAG: 2-C-methyl-D-erythritol 2,4-cyclodiphosphate synthase [Elusimicrobia bacterium]|nr:2-C-methyl-D-erythritol 2,4-cyclodiphosphate synthase [Elusimicrobiota bacterium]